MVALRLESLSDYIVDALYVKSGIRHAGEGARRATIIVGNLLFFIRQRDSVQFVPASIVYTKYFVLEYRDGSMQNLKQGVRNSSQLLT